MEHGVSAGWKRDPAVPGCHTSGVQSPCSTASVIPSACPKPRSACAKYRGGSRSEPRALAQPTDPGRRSKPRIMQQVKPRQHLRRRAWARHSGSQFPPPSHLLPIYYLLCSSTCEPMPATQCYCAQCCRENRKPALPDFHGHTKTTAPCAEEALRGAFRSLPPLLLPARLLYISSTVSNELLTS